MRAVYTRYVAPPARDDSVTYKTDFMYQNSAFLGDRQQSEIELAPYGVQQSGEIYAFGRLGLITPVGLHDVYWALIG